MEPTIRMVQLTREELIELCANWANYARELEKIVESPMVTVLRKAQMQESAQLIRDELVCCDIYDRLVELLTPEGHPTYAHRTLRNSVEYHGICHFGEWAARIVEKGPRT